MPPSAAAASALASLTAASANSATRLAAAIASMLGGTARGQPWRDVLLSLSRFWQIESRYRANAKYQPEWDPRFICFRSSADLPRIGIAALRAEAFIITPA
jgi:lysyl-tRNA synthetase, class II